MKGAQGGARLPPFAVNYYPRVGNDAKVYERTETNGAFFVYYQQFKRCNIRLFCLVTMFIMPHYKVYLHYMRIALSFSYLNVFLIITMPGRVFLLLSIIIALIC